MRCACGTFPPLTQLTGQLTFTEQSMEARDVAAEVFGGPARISVDSSEGRVQVTANGTAQLAIAKRELTLPLLQRVTGTAEWQLATNTRDEFSAWTLTSSLKGTAIDLPAPLGKSAADAVAFRVERREIAGKANEDMLNVDFGPEHRVIVHRRLGKERATVDRALVLLGNAVARGGAPDRDGIWVRGTMPELDLDEWLALYFKEFPPATSTPPATARASAARPLELNGIELETGTTRCIRPAVQRSQGRGAAQLRGRLAPAPRRPRSGRHRRVARTGVESSERSRDGSARAFRAARPGPAASRAQRGGIA